MGTKLNVDKEGVKGRLEILEKRYKACNQGHVLENVETLTLEQKLELVNQLESIPVENLEGWLQSAQSKCGASRNEEEEEAYSPYEGPVACIKDSSKEQLMEWESMGRKAIEEGTAAAVLLAGGQGTRLGFDGPKGMYDIGLPSKRTLFRLIAERLYNLSPSIPLYIMTSPMNDETTRTYWSSNNNFGLHHVQFFMQGVLPCLSNPDGKILMESTHQCAMAPDGNGGIYGAMEKSGVIRDMEEKGVQHIHAFAIDNALVKPVDPIFIGYCISQNADCGNKVVWKVHPDEKVGVMLQNSQGQPCIVEYSDVSPALRNAISEETGKLKLGAGNICNHYYTLSFLQTHVLPHLNGSDCDVYHLAKKNIPIMGGTNVVPGFKLESFIFHIFPLSQRMAILDVPRESEFAPVKNAPGSTTDCPDTARLAISNLSKQWLQNAGAKLLLNNDNESSVCEVSPLTSYNGENLSSYQGKEISCPFSI